VGIVTVTTSEGGVSAAAGMTTVLPDADLQSNYTKLEHNVKDQLKKSTSVRNNEAILSIISATAGYINNKNCSGATNSFCASLNRQPCSVYENTCGFCLSTHPIGFNQPANQMCYGFDNLERHRRLIDIGDEAKTCINDCSNNGACVSTDYGGRSIPAEECTISYGFCHTRCVCNTGYFGDACEFRQSSEDLRVLLCSALQDVVAHQDVTSDALSTRALLVTQLFTDTSQVNSISMFACGQALFDSILSNYELAASDGNIQAVLAAMASIISSLDAVMDRAEMGTSDTTIAGLYNLVESIDSVLASLSDGMLLTVALGEPAINISNSEIRLVASLLELNASFAQQSKQRIRMPQSALETVDNSPSAIAAFNFTKTAVGMFEAVGLVCLQYTRALSFDKTVAAPFIGFRVDVLSLNIDRGTADVASQQQRRRRALRRDALSDRAMVRRGEAHGWANDDAWWNRELADSNEQDHSIRQLDAAVDAEVTLDASFQFVNTQPINYYVTDTYSGVVDCLRTGVSHVIIVNCSSTGGDRYNSSLHFNCPGTYGKQYNYTVRGTLFYLILLR
jgi:hypothetical protein